MSKPYNFTAKTKPFDHQVDAFHFSYDKPYSALFMEQGTGKTKVVIDLACNYFMDGKINAVMVIAPNGVHDQWVKEQLPQHSSIKSITHIWHSTASKGEKLNRKRFIEKDNTILKWFAVNVEAFSTANHIKVFRDFLKTHNVLLVVDESTRIKNPEANRTINIMHNLCKIVKDSRKVIDVIPLSKYRMVLTGTMITNSPFDLWSMFEFLHHDYFGMNYYAFKARYGIEVQDVNQHTRARYKRKIRPDEIDSVRRYIGDGKHVEAVASMMNISESSVQYIVDHPNITLPYKRLTELRDSIQEDAFIIRKEDCLDLPPKVYSIIKVKMGPDQKRVYNDLRGKYLAEYAGKELTVQNKVTLVGRLQQVTGGFFPYKDDGTGKGHIIPIAGKNNKIEVIKNKIDEAGGGTIIVWARFVGELKLLHQQLKKSYPEKNIALYYGGVTKSKRSQIIKSFQKGKVNILIANPATAGTGLNLQLSHHQIFFSNSYSMEERQQAEDRSHRIGQAVSVLYEDIIVEGTVDETVFQMLQAKKDLLDFFRSKDISEII